MSIYITVHITVVNPSWGKKKNKQKQTDIYEYIYYSSHDKDLCKGSCHAPCGVWHLPCI